MKQKAGGEMDIRVLNYFLMVARKYNKSFTTSSYHTAYAFKAAYAARGRIGCQIVSKE